METIVQRAVARGELATTPPPRTVALPVDLLRHELFMTIASHSSRPKAELAPRSGAGSRSRAIATGEVATRLSRHRGRGTAAHSISLPCVLHDDT
jgi:hypothetical protein